MLIDEYMPRWDVRSRHTITVNTDPERTYAALRTADLGAHRVVRALLALRALPAAAGARRVRALCEQTARPVTLAVLEAQGFCVLAERPPCELLLGLEGAFWKPGGGLRPVSVQTFVGPVPPGVARAAWTFIVTSAGLTHSVLATETRVLAGDASARRWFRLYWSMIGWGSGLIRRLMLRSIRAQAEHDGRDTR